MVTKINRKFFFTTRIKKQAKYTWRLLVPAKIARGLDMRKKVKITITQGEDLE